MVTTPKSSLLGDRAASFLLISPGHRAATVRVPLVFRASLGRRSRFSAELKFWRRLLTFPSPPTIRPVPERSPIVRRPNRAAAVERFRSEIELIGSEGCRAVAGRSPGARRSTIGRSSSGEFKIGRAPGGACSISHCVSPGHD